MLEENQGLSLCRQVKASPVWRHCLIADRIIESSFVSNKTSEITYLFPLYIYPEKSKKDNPGHGFTTMMIFEPGEKYGRKPNISPIIFSRLEENYKKRLLPEEIFYYVYGILYSNIYRTTYSEFLKIDFPRVPFTVDYKIFKQIGKLGKELADLHLLKSPLLDPPIAKYRGTSDNDRIEKVTYNLEQQRIYINAEKCFEGVSPEVWNYPIGGYQVLQKYLKDRKGRIMDDAPHFCRIVTALSKTIDIQAKIEEVYPAVEKELVQT